MACPPLPGADPVRGGRSAIRTWCRNATPGRRLRQRGPDRGSAGPGGSRRRRQGLEHPDNRLAAAGIAPRLPQQIHRLRPGRIPPRRDLRGGPVPPEQPVRRDAAHQPRSGPASSPAGPWFRPRRRRPSRGSRRSGGRRRPASRRACWRSWATRWARLSRLAGAASRLGGQVGTPAARCRRRADHLDEPTW